MLVNDGSPNTDRAVDSRESCGGEGRGGVDWRESGKQGLNTRKTFETGTNPIESITLFVCPLVTG